MESNTSIFIEAFHLITSFNISLYEIIFTSLKVSLLAVFLSCVISIPLATLISIKDFLGKKFLMIVVNALMGLPPVVVGLFIYLLLSYQGPLSAYNLLYTESAMIIAQFVIVTPIIIALSKQTMDIIYAEYKDFILSLKLSTIKSITLMIYDTRHLLITTGLAGLGRALAEVGAVMIVGGNIAHQTRMMTTSIALETSRGDLSRALALGIILIFLSVLISLIGEKFKNNKLLTK